LAGEPENIDPGKSTEQAGATIVSNIFAGLTQAHPVTLAPLPDIADSWEVSEDGLRYVFHLRESRWSDGAPLTAADFQYAWQRVLDPRTGSRYASILFGLKHAALFNRRALCVRGVGGAGQAELRALLEPIAPIELLTLDAALDAAFIVVGGDERAREHLLQALHERTWQGRTLRVRAMDASQVGVHAQDERTLVVNLETPLPYFLRITKHPTALPVPRHVIERLQRQGKNEELWSRPENIVSNGAYVLSDAKFRQSMLLERNPHYWDAEHVKLSRIRIAMIENYNTTLKTAVAAERGSAAFELSTLGNEESRAACHAVWTLF
jgi:oligopeptide transport system substrate-binding protein